MNHNEFDAAIKSAPAVLALRDFILNKYAPGTYSNSWESYATTCSEEEILLDEAVTATNDDEHPNYLQYVPELMIAIVCEHCTTTSEALRFQIFMTDVMSCLFRCNVNETKELIDEEA